MKQIAIKLIIALLLSLILFLSWRFYLQYEDKALRKAFGLLKEEKYEQAISIIKSYSDNNSIRAKRLLARVYAFGLGVEIDITQAKKLLECDNNEECVPGKEEFGIGLDHDSPYGGEINKEMAIKWISYSASLGYSPAQKWLSDNK
ncbi:MAG: hypothetical protein AAGB12_05240 [Pseudomonadota bacterium]